MNRIDPALFSQCFTAWVRETWPDKPDFVAIDGKASRRSHDRSAGRAPLQHPRDLFDARDLLANEGVDDALRRTFLVYLISHDRPMAEVLAVRRKDIKAEFERGFAGMTRQPVAFDELLAAREALISEVVGSMPRANPHSGFRFVMSAESMRSGFNDWERIDEREAL